MLASILTAIAVLLRIFSNPLGNVFQKQLTAENNHPLLVNFLSYFILSLLCISIIAGVKLPPLPAQFWIFSILAGIMGGLGNGFLVKALERGDLSVLGPINSYKSVVGIIGAVFLLNEIPNIWGVAGVVLIIYGSYFVLDTTAERFSLAILRKTEIQYRILAMILTAVEAVFIKKIILVSSVTLAFVSWCWSGVLFSFILMFVYRLNFKNELKKIRKTHISKYVAVIICIGTMQMSTNYVFDHLPIGYALSLFQLSVIVSVVLGHRFFREKDIEKKLIGSAIMVIGSVLIILLKSN